MFSFKKISTGMLIAVFLGINTLLLLYIAFFKRDALRLETLKVGGSDNMQLVTKLYKSDSYKQQQAATIQQILGSMQGAATDQAAQGNSQEVAVPAE